MLPQLFGFSVCPSLYKTTSVQPCKKAKKNVEIYRLSQKVATKMIYHHLYVMGACMKVR